MMPAARPRAGAGEPRRFAVDRRRAQALALFPGVSRSGITIITGLWRKLTREDATKFSFLLSRR